MNRLLVALFAGAVACTSTAVFAEDKPGDNKETTKSKANAPVKTTSDKKEADKTASDKKDTDKKANGKKETGKDADKKPARKKLGGCG